MERDITCGGRKREFILTRVLVAFIIVVMNEEERSSWDIAAYRMASVIAGCLIGLVINYVFEK